MTTPRLAGYELETLSKRITDRTGVPLARARRAAARALRHAFGRDAHGDCDWTEAALTAAGIGAWARPALLELDPAPSLRIAQRAPSADGTTRLLLEARDGALVEAVIIPAEAGRDSARTTLCLSSQVGCKRACTFCETGTHGLSRQLGSDEIVDQYRLARRVCEGADRPLDRRAAAHAPPRASAPDRRPRAADQPISNIVFMGMGEPFDNLPEVVRAISLLSEQHAFGFAPSRITVSTVGCADKLQRFFASTRAELAISLNAPDDARRSAIMPINQRFDLATLRARLLEALPPGRRVLFQYALFDGFNDSLADADAVAAYVQGIRCRVNVIPANPGPDPSLRAPSDEAVDAFVGRLRASGVTTLVRRPRGRDVGGACGQLAGKNRLRKIELPAT
jgi:23S rRNA (adenine2503-C2)-methyltransferase